MSLRIALQKLKGIATSQRCDINSIRSYKISYVNSVDLNPPSSALGLDSVATNQLDKMEGVMVSVVKCLHSLETGSARKHDDEDNDHDDDSLSSLNQTNMLDFLKGALK